MKGIRIKKSIEIFFVILIIMGLCISAVVLMNTGKNAYERILNNNNQLEGARIALSYLGMRLRQNNSEGRVIFIPGGIDNEDTIKLKHSGDLEGMATYIYFTNGELREIYTWDGTVPDSEFSKPIIGLEGLDMKYNGGYFRFTAHYTEDGLPRSLEQIIGIVGN